ncbi:hypothetical protein KD33_12205 [Clostridium sp. NCR]|nr:hypothetical protein KD33_12205 [Clostridium sp. NCR]
MHNNGKSCNCQFEQEGCFKKQINNCNCNTEMNHCNCNTEMNHCNCNTEINPCNCNCNLNCDCDCNTPVDNCKSVECCCKLSIKRAAEILGKDQVRALINFNAAAFISDFFLVGTTLVPLGTSDNLGPLTGSLDRLDPCNCDLIDISGALAYPNVLNTDLLAELEAILGLVPGILTTLAGLLTDITGIDIAALVTALNALVPGLGDLLGTVITTITGTVAGTITTVTDIVTELIEGLITALITGFSGSVDVGANADLASLCAIKAMAFEVAGATPELQVANFNALRDIFNCFKCHTNEDCEPECCECCCCGNGIINEVASGNLSGTTSLTVGSLVLEGVEILGCANNALILGAPFIPATPTTPAVNARIYVVCAEAVQFIG